MGFLIQQNLKIENVAFCSASKYMNHTLKSKGRFVNPYPQKNGFKRLRIFNSVPLYSLGIPQFLFISYYLMKRTEEFCNLPKAELILYFSNYLPVKLFNCSFADLTKYSWFNRKYLLPWTLFRILSSLEIAAIACTT